MSELRKIIELNKETRKLIVEYDYGYFLMKNIAKHNYPKEQIDRLYKGYETEKKIIKKGLEENKKQFLFHLDGQIRKRISGGELTNHFELNESRDFIILSNAFEEIGAGWAVFETWKKYEKRRIYKEEFWNIVIKIGAILGFVLTIIKIIEELSKK